TWGGYHDYDVNSIIDLEDRWSATIFLTGESNHPVDNYPGSTPCIETDFTIRRLQTFKLAPLAEFSWRITNRQGQTVQSGKAFADPDGRPRIQGVTVCKEPMWATITLFKEEQERCNDEDELLTTPGEYCQVIDVSGVSREFITIVPQNYNHAQEHPLLFVFHPGGGGMVNFRYGHIVGDGTGREELFSRAEDEGMIVVIPQATFNEEINNTVWNTFENYPQDSTWVDDLSFVEVMLEHHRSVLNIDDNRIYTCGFSKGGDFSQFLGSQMACTFAGVAAVGSSAGEAVELGSPELEFNPIGEVPVPALIMKGYLDFKRPFEGGLNNTGNYTTSAFQDFHHWMENNGCDTMSIQKEVIIPDSTILYTNTDCNRSEVQFYECIQLPHIWPDSIHNVGVNANRLFIDFLKRQTNITCRGSSVSDQSLVFNIYPNPAIDVLTVDMNSHLIDYSIFNYSGELVINGRSSGSINISGLAVGLYFIRVIENGIVGSRTFVKIH
ncbi:MAG: T9SS type A sorting domain-containing protein, partial [Saprospiraceae bacterium]|nr:T9SS type A sorting domain-containing protein [Saprospiraceae bacterium]